MTASAPGSMPVNVLVFWTVQASALLVLTAPVEGSLVALWAISHFSRAIGLTLSFHRYFAHRAFEMNRGARFFWALLGTAAMQKGPLWWAGNHVDHHRFADREGDPHSPRQVGLYRAHVGWFLDAAYDDLDPENPVVRDFSSDPEIRLLDRFFVIPPLALAIGMVSIGGLPWLAWGFCLPTVTLAHATFAINSVNHVWGTRRFDVADDSTNHPATAFFAAGEGWHNNHHRYPRAARNGFYWWEIDPTWWCVRAMEIVGLAWDVRRVPDRVYQEAAERLARAA